MTMLEKAQKVFDETKSALQTVYDGLNEGQKKQINDNVWSPEAYPAGWKAMIL